MILVCGEALIDLLVEAAAPDAAAVPTRAVAGGAPFSLAIGLARPGAASGFLGGFMPTAAGLRAA